MLTTLDTQTFTKIPPVSFCYFLSTLTSKEKKKIAIATITCGVALPIVGGVVAFFVSSAILRQKRIRIVYPIEPPPQTEFDEKMNRFLDQNFLFENFSSFRSTDIVPIAESNFPSAMELRFEKSEGIEEILLNKDSHSFPITIYELLNCFGDFSKKTPVNFSQKVAALIKIIQKEMTGSETFEEEGSLLWPVVEEILRVAVQKNEIVSITKLSQLDQSPFTEKILLSNVLCIPYKVFSFKKLKHLKIHSQRLIGISNDITLLQHLRILKISGSIYLKKLPDVLSSLQELRAIHLSDLPALHKLFPSIGKLHKLSSLRIVHTGIESIPPSISSLSNMKSLILSFNPCLSSIPKSIAQLPLLKTLSFSSCEKLELSSQFLEQISQRSISFTGPLTTPKT